MNPCRNCGKLNNSDTNFCRFCGSKFIAVPSQPQSFPNQTPPPLNDSPFDHAAPRPYAWKTDEFQTQSDARKTRQTGYVQAQTSQFDQLNSAFRPAPLAKASRHHLSQGFQCPSCGSQLMPRLEKRISTAGWITFAVLLVFFFPLFWIGLLIKEDVPVCQTCNLKLAIGPYR